MKIQYSEIKKNNGVFEKSPILEEDYNFIYDFINSNNGQIKSTIETGMAFGFSTIAIMSATDTKHIAIDPFQFKFYRNKGLTNIRSHFSDTKGLDFTLIEDFSFNALPHLLKDTKSFDFCFIDGSHTFEDAFCDFFYMDKMLNQFGYLLIHDTWMPALQKVSTFISTNKSENYVSIPLPETLKDHMALYQKVKTNNRKHEDYFIQF